MNHKYQIRPTIVADHEAVYAIRVHIEPPKTKIFNASNLTFEVAA